MNNETPKQAASYGEPDNVRTTEINEADVHSAYLDSDGSLYLYDKGGKDLFGWPKSWPEHIADVATFLAAREISYVNKPALPAISYAFESDTPQLAPASYGEPLDTQGYNASGRWVLDSTDPATLRRAVECWNACAGIADPAEAIQNVRSDLESIRDILSTIEGLTSWDDAEYNNASSINFEADRALDVVRAALAQLNNTK